ncbi:MAG: hypothetical protein Hyperionvirus37_4 [Hyperionvirus sp.]|uniref:C3H1-type domain-containing protein n=1 Tax=Hyperionvirus sp. TaxID=2487770 RepID=A0A3G5AEP5_9VIRU|nr:MAG: hypothetical protein Hyperionvirus37_4 [Hyperionvirus sp.]
MDRSDKWITVINRRAARRDGGGYQEKERHQADMKNMKKVLCNNVLIAQTCHYGDKCMYAHSLEDQNVEGVRRKAYDILEGVEKINYKPDRELSKTLLQLTKICEACCKNKCPGGYNCKYGVFDKKYQVCEDDLRYGICYNTMCNNIHLTNRGLIPLNSIGKHEPIKIIKVDRSKNVSVPDGTLLSDDFFQNLKENSKNSYDIDDSSEDESMNDDDRGRIKEFLDCDSDSDKSCDESIFDVCAKKRLNNNVVN